MCFFTGLGSLIDFAEEILGSPHLPMLRDVAEPGDAGGFERGVGIEAAGDGAVDDGLLLLPQQRDQLPLRPDEPVDLPVRMVQKPHDRRLLVGGGSMGY